MTIETYPEHSAIDRSIEYPFNLKYKTEINQAASGVEQSLELMRFPVRGFGIAYKALDLANADTIRNFFIARRGRSKRFWFNDSQKRSVVDEYVGRGGPLELTCAVADDGGTQTNETVAANSATANDMTLLPAVPAQNDAYYFVSATQFDKLTLTIGTQGVGTWTIVWEYYKSDDTWAALAGVADGTTGFTAAAGARDVTFTIPTDWKITEVGGVNGYAIRARVSAYVAVTTQPKGTIATVNSKTYELHSKTTTSATLKVYVNDVLKTGGGADYTFVSGGGASGADRITFTAYQTQGYLITDDHEGYLRLKMRFAEDGYLETPVAKDMFSVETSLVETHW